MDFWAGLVLRPGGLLSGWGDPRLVINQWYADARRCEGWRRGFAFPGVTGRLQACGNGGSTALPTGPWADKAHHASLHRRHDLQLETLRYEVGYTPVESVATGLAAVRHDIGGHNRWPAASRSEPGSTRLPDDLYARWVQFGTFQPIDRLHSNHSDRCPGSTVPRRRPPRSIPQPAREPGAYTYTLAKEASVNRAPIARRVPEYPAEAEAYANASASTSTAPTCWSPPATTPGTTATTPVWFPPGSSWTDLLHPAVPTRAAAPTRSHDPDTMPVFIRSGGS